MTKIAYFFAVAAVLGMTGCGGRKPVQPASAETVRDIAVVQVARATVPNYVEAVGTVRAAQTSVLSAQVVGTVTAVQARDGQ